MRNKCKRKYAFFTSFTRLCFLAGPSSVQYQHGTPVLYQAQSGSPPATGLQRVSLSTGQQGPTGHTTVSLAQGIPQQQQVMSCWTTFFLFYAYLLHVRVTLPICAGDYSGSGSGARGRNTKAGRLFIHSRRSQGPREAVERRQCRVSQVTPRIPSPQREGPDGIKGLHVSPIFSISSALAHLYCLFSIISSCL